MDFLNSLSENEQLDVCIPSPNDRNGFGDMYASHLAFQSCSALPTLPTPATSEDAFEDASSEVESDGLRDSGCYISGRDYEDIEEARDGLLEL